MLIYSMILHWWISEYYGKRTKGLAEKQLQYGGPTWYKKEKVGDKSLNW